MKSTKQKQEVTKFQKFETVKIHRSKLLNAPYNPRIMDDNALKRLKKVIKKVGLIEPPVWNKRSGNLIGGHQRLRVLDSLNKSEDYYLTVSVVDFDDKAEVEANIALNNPSIQGEFDIDALDTLRTDFDLDFKDIGFTDSDLDLLFDGEVAQLLEDTPGVKKAKDTLTEIKDIRKQATEKFKENNSGDFFFVVVCESQEDKENLMKNLKVPKWETYIGAHSVRSALKTSEAIL